MDDVLKGSTKLSLDVDNERPTSNVTASLSRKTETSVANGDRGKTFSLLS